MGVLLRSLRSTSQKTLPGHVFNERTDFDAGLLPLQRDVIEVMIHHLMPRGEGNKQPSTHEVALRVASQLLEHWVHCTVYPKHRQQILQDVLNLYSEFNNMVRVRKERRTEIWKQEKMEPYVERISNSIFDISTHNSNFLKKQESFYGAKMSQVEWDFLEDQKLNRKMYCTSFVDEKWKAGAERRKKQEQAMATMKANEQERMTTMDKNENETFENESEEEMQVDKDYEVEVQIEEAKRKERAFGIAETKKVG